MQEAPTRYSTVSILLHWAIVLLLVTNVLVGGWMEDAKGPAKGDYFQVHRAVGLTVLALTVARIGWRLTHKWPAFPDHMAAWERLLARGTHVAFYLLTLGIPLLGLAAVTVGDDALGDQLGGTHKLAVKLLYVVVALHVAGALKHHFLDRDAVLHRMLPIVKPRRR